MAVTRAELDRILKQVHDITEAIRSNSVTKDTAESVIRELVKKNLASQSQSLEYASGSVYERYGLDDEVQEYGDYLLLAKSAIEAQRGRKADIARIRKNMLDLGLVKPSAVAKVEKAMGTSVAGGGLEWVPTEFSPKLIDRVRLELRVAALHERIPMPTNPYKAPVVAADASAYLAAENVSNDKVYLTPSQPSTTNITFVAKKLACRIIVSDELTEDSIVPILPFMREQAVMALANAQEDATINGDTDIGTASATDADMRDAADANNPRAAWNGYREVVAAAAKVDLGTFNIQNLRLIRQKMGKYGVNPGRLAWVVSLAAYNKMLSLPELLTVDKYGAQATLLQGELGRLDNIPIIVSEFVRQDLNATGVYDGVTTDRTIVLLVYRPGFLYGDRREVTVRSKEDWETEQTVLAASQRIAFQPVYDVATEPLVGLGYNVAV